jgi:hypothetical protein
MALRKSVVLVLIGGLALAVALHAAQPQSGSVSAASPEVSWTGGPFVTSLPLTETQCPGDLPEAAESLGCDSFHLTIEGVSGNYAVSISTEPGFDSDDYDLHVYGPDGSLVESSAGSDGWEEVDLIVPSPGTYEVVVQAWLVGVGSTYSAVATYRQLPPEVEGPSPAPEEERPYDILVAPAPLGRTAGEPTLGVNEARDGAIMYISGTQTLRLRADDATSPPLETWEDVSFLTTSLVTFDPILWTDQQTGRTFVSQLLFPAKQSAMAFTDDDGESWTPSQGSGINTGVDHQAVGGGPFPEGFGSINEYPNAVYFCAQDIALAECAVSLDGGLTFGPGVPIYDLTQCGGLHGHPKVAPDGTVYMPNKSCGGQQAVIVSEDAGATWQVRQIPGTTAGDWDPSVYVASDGTVYVGMTNGDLNPYVAVSHDKGLTWNHVQDVGLPFGIEAAAFPVIVAGDPDRAAFAFHGTKTPGNAFADDPTFPGEWHLYAAHTYDGGATWDIVNATVDDPTQRGTICGGGIGCSTTRNLLDFMDATIDEEGRVLVAYADGCVSGCVNGAPNSRTEIASVARQATGKRMYAANDPVAGPPTAPRLTATFDEVGNVDLAWSTPINNGSALTGYHLYRTSAAGEELLGSFGTAVHSFTDQAPPPGEVTYAATAENGFGEGPRSPATAPAAWPGPEEDSCQEPGLTMVAADGGDTALPALDVETLGVAEPAFIDGSWKVVFTLKVGDLSNLTAGSAWYILWNRPLPDGDFDRNYVVMRATGNDTADFKHGKVTPPSVNQAMDMGDADAGSFTPDGTIRIEISPDKIDSPQPGWDLAGIEVRTFAASTNGAPITGLLAQDTTPAAVYQLRGNAACRSNSAPVAVDDNATTRENKPVHVDVLANDSDPDGDPIEVIEVGEPANGRVLASKASGRVSYKPDQGFTGVDAFSYTISDGTEGTATATVTVVVEPK